MSTEIMGFGEQVVLPDTFYVITMIDAAADNIHQHVAALKRDAVANRNAIRATAAGARWYSDFTSFDNQWVDWYAANRYTTAGLFRNLNGASVGAVRNFAARFNTFESQYTALGFTPTAVGGPEANPIIPPEVVHALYFTGGVIGLGLVAWLAYSASKFAPAANVAAERFRTTQRSFPAMAGIGRGRSALSADMRVPSCYWEQDAMNKLAKHTKCSKQEWNDASAYAWAYKRQDDD